MRARADRRDVEALELVAHAGLLAAAQSGDQLVVSQLEHRVDPAAGPVEVAGHAAEQPRPGRAGVARAERHGASAVSAALRWRRLSAVSTSFWAIRPRPSRSAIVWATRTTRWRPRALSAPEA